MWAAAHYPTLMDCLFFRTLCSMFKVMLLSHSIIICNIDTQMPIFIVSGNMRNIAKIKNFGDTEQGNILVS